jgi:hypothetical protein
MACPAVDFKEHGSQVSKLIIKATAASFKGLNVNIKFDP